MLAKPWIEVKEGLWLKVTFPCPKRFYLTRHARHECQREGTHGHVEMTCEDGYGIVPFPCQSRDGVQRVVEALAAECGETWDAKGVLETPEVKAMPAGRTLEERIIFASPERLKEALSFSLWSP